MRARAESNKRAKIPRICLPVDDVIALVDGPTPPSGDCSKRCPNEERFDHCGCLDVCCYCGKAG